MSNLLHFVIVSSRNISSIKIICYLNFQVFKSLEAGKWLDEEAYEVDYFPAVKVS